MFEGIWPWALGCCAALVIGLSKTAIPGAGILAAALMASVFPAKQSVGATLPMLIAADIAAVVYYRQHADWRRVLELLPSVLLGMLGAALVLSALDSAQFRPLLGTLILALLALEMLRRKFGSARLPHRAWFVVMCGVSAGFATALGNAAGPIMSIYFVSRGLEKERFLGSAAWYFLIVNGLKLPIYAFLGMVSKESLSFDLYMLPAIVAGAALGRCMIRRMRPKIFVLIVFALAALAGLKLIL